MRPRGTVSRTGAGRAWHRRPASAVLHRLADLIEAQALELAVLGVRDNGTEINMAFKAEPGSAAGTFRYYAEAIDKVYGEIAPTARQRAGAGASRAGRCRRRHRAVELPADDRRLENRPGACRRQFTVVLKPAENWPP